MAAQSKPLPLKGIRVIDFTQIFMGPAATQVLGDFGADVIKIERPNGGDIFRWSFDDSDELDHPPFCALNRNKRSVAVDVRSEEGRAIVHELVRSSDVVVSNFRPGVMERLGFGYEQLSALNPRLVYASGSGFGQDGPYAYKGGQDVLAQAFSGAMAHKIGAQTHSTIYPLGIADYGAAMHMVQGILLALIARHATGKGARVDVNLYDSLLALQMQEAAMLLQRDAELNWAAMPLVGTFRTLDGEVVIVGAFKLNALRDICTALEIEDLSARAEFSSFESQMANRGALQSLLAEQLATGTTDRWLARLEEQDILCAPVRTLQDALNDPQTLQNDMLVDMVHPTVGAIRAIGSPVHLLDTPIAVSPPPTLGQDTDEVLRKLGYTDDEITKLRSLGIIGAVQVGAP